MRSSNLWIDRRGANVYWPMAGNVSLSKGTLAVWVQTPANGYDWWREERVWQLHIDANNFIRNWAGRGVWVRAAGVNYRHDAGAIQRGITATPTWELHVHRWNFAANTVESYYNAGIPASATLTAPQPTGSISKLYHGREWTNPVGYDDDDMLIAQIGIWDDWMTIPQMQALHAEGRRFRWRAEDGTGNLLFLNTFGSHTADVYGGASAAAAQDAGPGADMYCLLNDGIIHLATSRYALGMPRHDDSEDDRIPLNAVCKLRTVTTAMRTQTTDQNLTTYSRLAVSNYTSNREAGAGFPTVPNPGTYRQLIHVPDDVPQTRGLTFGIGPLGYVYHPLARDTAWEGCGPGQRFVVVADAGNSATQFKVAFEIKQGEFNQGSWSGNNYWVGAPLSFFSGNVAGCTLTVAAYNDTTKVFTVNGTLPATPSVGAIGYVDFIPRIIGRGYEHLGNAGGAWRTQFAVAANLNMRFGTGATAEHFLWIDWQHVGDERSNCPIVRYDYGRAAYMPGFPWPYFYPDLGASYGKRWESSAPANPVTFELWLRKIEVLGPQTYQTVRKQQSGEGPALQDSFMALTRTSTGVAGDSVKVWRKSNLTWGRQKPTKNQNWQAAVTDLQAAGSWRHTVRYAPVPVVEDPVAGTVTCAVVGIDPAGVYRMGYVVGSWNEATGRISWVDETPPANRTNPCLEWATLRTDYETDAPYIHVSMVRLEAIVPEEGGTWALIYEAEIDDIDGTRQYALVGARDRWSFNHSEQFIGEFVPPLGSHAVDMRNPITGHGFNTWFNTDMFGSYVYNPYAAAPRRRYFCMMRGKSIANIGGWYSADVRTMMGLCGRDVASITPLPYRNAMSPLVTHPVHGGPILAVYGEDCIVSMWSHNNRGIGLSVSEDYIHWQEIFPSSATSDDLIVRGELPGESATLLPAHSFRLGDRRIYYYVWYHATSGYNVNFSHGRLNGETFYRIADGQTGGWLETCTLERPPTGWGDLYVNCDPGDGTVAVEVVNMLTNTVITGFGFGSCDGIANGVERRVTWSGSRLNGRAETEIRLRFRLTRPSAGATSPRLYDWAIDPPARTARVQLPSLQGEGNVGRAIGSVIIA